MSSVESFKSKLYRYCFFGWLLEQPPADIYGRNAVRTANRERLERWLPHYVRVHAVLSVICGGLLGGALVLELDLLEIVSTAGATGVEICITLTMFAAYAALRLQAVTGDVDNS